MNAMLKVSVVVDGCEVIVFVPAKGRNPDNGTICVTESELMAALAEEMMEAA